MTAAWDRSGAGQRLQTAVISCENTVLLYGSETNFWGGSKFLDEMLYFSEVRFFHAYITKNGNSTCCALCRVEKVEIRTGAKRDDPEELCFNRAER